MPKPKKYYIVVECSNCRRLLLAASDKKTRTCPYCGKRVNLEDARIVAKSESAEEARRLLQELKVREHSKSPTGPSGIK
jgi:RNA polymerase subunit RPABC4/transcription elongation factor Spt4